MQVRAEQHVNIMLTPSYDWVVSSLS